MDSYMQSYNPYDSSPSSPCVYSNYNSASSTNYCSCCYSSIPYYPQHVSSSFVYSPPTSPYIPQQRQMTTSVVTTSNIQAQQSSSKITRLQYTNKDRYILNELFKRTPYPNAMQRDIIAQQLDISHEQIRIWFQNRRRLQTQRDSGERLTSSNEMMALQHGKANTDINALKKIINDVAKYKNAPPRLRLNDSN